MAHRWDLTMLERYGVASLCVGSMRDQVSMRDCVVPYASSLGGFIYAAS
jgi:hypothetical protein